MGCRKHTRFRGQGVCNTRRRTRICLTGHYSSTPLFCTLGWISAGKWTHLEIIWTNDLINFISPLVSLCPGMCLSRSEAMGSPQHGCCIYYPLSNHFAFAFDRLLLLELAKVPIGIWRLSSFIRQRLHYSRPALTLPLDPFGPRSHVSSCSQFIL